MSLFSFSFFKTNWTGAIFLRVRAVSQQTACVCALLSVCTQQLPKDGGGGGGGGGEAATDRLSHTEHRHPGANILPASRPYAQFLRGSARL